MHDLNAFLRHARAGAVALVAAAAWTGSPAQTSAPPQAQPARAAAPAAGASAPARGGSSGAEAACRASDLNHDGYISLEEFHRDIVRSWAALGPDASGYVSLADLAAIPGMRRSVVDRLKRADTDGDGRLSFKEVVAARMAHFEEADTDRDDRLSMKECVDQERRLAARARAERGAAATR